MGAGSELGDDLGEGLSGASTIIAGGDGSLGGAAAMRASTLIGEDDLEVGAAGTVLAETGDGTGDTPLPGASIGGPPRLPAGTRVGRYVLFEPLGAGGMGVVYRAFDPELERWLAIKILRADRREASGSGRFLREAQVMARLSHPNVVPIHDVGAWTSGMFLAMELVEGETLRKWQEARQRGWREVVEMYAQAGRGLVEAHAAGIVHRDFKPENVLVDARGRARVTDFGLARSAAIGEAPDGALPLGSSRLTRSGMILGTPAYMAPEQLGGGKVDARADVFAFSAALYEALHGHTPFGGRTFAERIEAIREGLLRVPSRRLPRWLLRAIARGLAHRASARPDMAALLAELERGLARRRSAWFAGAAALGLAVAVPLSLSSPGARCDGAAAALAGVWDDEARAAVAAALRASGRAYAEDTWAKVHDLLNMYVESWSALHRGSCEAHARGEISAALLDRRALCLGERRADLALLIEALRRGDAATAEKAVSMALSLEPIAGCRDPAAESRDPSELLWAEQTRARIARVRLLDIAGQLDEGLQEIHHVEAEAAARGDEALRIEATLVRAHIEYARGDPERAQRTARAAFEGAHALGRDAQATEAASLLILLDGEVLARYDLGEVWAKLALAGARRIGDDGGAEATARHFYGTMLSSADRGEEALVQLERAFALRTALLGPDHLDTSLTAMSLGNALWKRGRLEEGLRFHQTAVDSRVRTLGPDHPALIAPLANLGVSFEATGRLEEARRVYARSLALVITNYSEGHPNAALLHSNLGTLESALGDLASARRHAEAAVRVARATLGEDHPDTALVLLGLANVMARQDEAGGAEALMRDALQRTARSVGAGHSNHAAIGLALARLLRTRERLAEARPLVTAALATCERVLGREHPRTAEALVALAELDQAAGALPQALAGLERARAIVETAAVTPGERGRTLLALARVVHAQGREPERVRALVDAVRRLAEEAGEAGAELRAELAAWTDAPPETAAAPDGETDMPE